MGLHITKTRKGSTRIRATGSDANGLFIAFMGDDSLKDAYAKKTGSEEFQRMVAEAMVARGLLPAPMVQSAL